MYIRYQSAVPNRRGSFPGVFALANGLAHHGRLSKDDWEWWRCTNDYTNTLYTDPATVDARVFDDRGARSWFKDGGRVELRETTLAYLRLLDRYAVPWVELRTGNPGHIIYSDDDQVVAVPYSHADWAL